MTNEILPQTSDNVSIMSVFYLALMIESAVSVAMACCVSAIYYRGRQTGPPQIPAWMKTLFANINKKIYRIDRSGFTVIKKKEDGTELRLLQALRPALAATLGDRLKKPTISTILPFLEMGLPKDSQNAGENLSGNQQQSDMSAEHHQSDPVEKSSSTADDLKLDQILSHVETIRGIQARRAKMEALRIDWEIIGYMMDRLYFVLFVLMSVFSISGIFATACFMKYPVEKIAVDL